MRGAVHATTLRAWLNDGGELAVIDIRDGGPYSREHILVATNIARSSFETQFRRLVPRQSVRTVLTDGDGSGLVEAATFLAQHGYSNVHVLEDGNAGWVSAGFALRSGSNIVSKVFGEMVEEKCSTPHIDAGTLSSWMAEGRPFHLFDVRPLAEYRTVSIPGATNCPGMETVLRIPHLLDDPTIPVVVNCAGRTRSIIGAQTLRESGILNPVFALENGTMGWQLHGLDPDQGQSNILDEPLGDDLDEARRCARAFAERNKVPHVAVAQLNSWLSDDSRTTYVFDVRLADAFARGRYPGSINAPGGQLIQSTDTFAAVRNARVVVVDELGVQSVMTVHWLRRMGWDAWVLEDPGNYLTEHGPESVRLLTDPDPRVISVSPEELRTLMERQACTVVDVGESYWYRQGRIPGSYYAMRSALATALSSFNREQMIVLCCSNGSQAPFAAGDALSLGFGRVGALVGGRSAWRAVGGDVETIGTADDNFLLTPTEDMWYPPWARAEGAREAMAEYLSWEVGLVERLRDEEYLHFADEFDLR